MSINAISAEERIYIENQTNDEIQKIIDNTNDNTTLIFTQEEYTNLNLILNRSINLQTENTTIKSNLENPIFTIINTKDVSIIGFRINSTNTGIQCINSNNILIKNNIIETKANGVLFTQITNGEIINNTLINNNISAITIQRSNRIKITENTIKNTKKDGIILEGSTTNVNITNNQLTENGIYLNYAINLISRNTNDKQTNIFIGYNNLTDNGNGINVNIATKNLNITENSIVRGSKGINLDQGYRNDETALFVEYNAFVQGTDLCIDARGSIYEEVGGISLGYNWFNRNSNNGFICPRVKAGILQSGIRQIGQNTYQAYFTQDGEEINTLANFNLRVKVNGKIGYATITNGQGTFTVPGDVGYENSVVIGTDEEIKLTIEEYKTPVNPKPNTNTQTNENQGNGSGTSNTPQSPNAVSEGSNNIVNSLSSNSVSPTSSSPSSSQSPDSSSQVIKTLTYDEDSFRIIGIPGLLLLIIIAILIYYNEDIRKALKK